MRTKTLLVAAAVLAAGLASSMAQAVYSQNVVGYVNIPVPANTKILMANQLNATNNTINSLLPAVPAGTFLYKFSGGYSSYVFDFDDFNNLVWQPDGNATLNPGEGCFFISPSATTLTFVGEVRQGLLTNTLPANTKVLRSSIVPQAGLITTTLGLPAEAGDFLYTYSGGFSSYVYDFDDFNNLIWQPSQPNINVGQAFFYTKSAAGTSVNWVRNFTVQ